MMKHVKAFESFLGEARITKTNDTRFGRNTSTIETLFFGNLNFETNVIPTTTKYPLGPPIIGSVTVVVKVGKEGSFNEQIKTYTISDATAKDISVKMKERYDSNDYKVDIPELEKLKEKVHKDELDAFVKGLDTFEKTYSKS
jgi:hypothetical protein